LTFGGVHGRNRVLATVSSLLNFLLKEREDDTRCLVVLARIYHILLFLKGMDKVRGKSILVAKIPLKIVTPFCYFRFPYDKNPSKNLKNKSTF